MERIGQSQPRAVERNDPAQEREELLAQAPRRLGRHGEVDEISSRDRLNPHDHPTLVDARRDGSREGCAPTEAASPDRILGDPIRL
jgi:hypothetical protein